MTRQKSIGYVAIFLLLGSWFFLFPQCARRVALTGGVQDTIAPYLVRAIPRNRTTNFQGQRLKLTFNEYVTLKNATQETYFSPPLRWPYGVVLQGKSLLFEINDTLQPDVTYRLHLGDAIHDLTEGNPYADSLFCFATGATLDTLVLRGQVRDALLHQPLPNVKVMLYRENTDSLPLQTLPNYVAVSNANGRFQFSNLPTHTFKIFALEDANANYLYDQPKERIAFTDSLYHPYPTHEPDSLHPTIRLDLFAYEKPPLLLRRAERPKPECVRCIFSSPTADSVSISWLNLPTVQTFVEHSPNHDTITYWLTDTPAALTDTLHFCLRYKATDSLQKLNWRTDTIRLGYAFAQDSLQNPIRKLTDSTLSLHLATPQDGIPAFDSLLLIAPTPITSINPQQISFRSDTVHYPIHLFPVAHRPRLWQVKGDWKPRATYTLQILPGAFRDPWNRTNDTLNINFNTLNPSQFAIVHLTVQNAPQHTLIQILTTDKKQTVLRSLSLPKGQRTIDIPYLPPNTYTMRFIDDTNNNGLWDTGNYSEHKLPEPLRYFKSKTNQSTFVLRANWEYDIDVDYLQLEE